jgi:hypothetical protein
MWFRPELSDQLSVFIHQLQPALQWKRPVIFMVGMIAMRTTQIAGIGNVQLDRQGAVQSDPTQ